MLSTSILMQIRRRSVLCAITTAIACAFVPQIASAATVTRAADGSLVYTAAPGEINHLDVQVGYDTGTTTLYESATTINPSVPAGCTYDGSIASVVTCPDPSAVRVDLGDGNDRLTESLELQVPVIAQGGAGNDNMTGSDAADQFDGGPGDDTLAGNGGDDTLLGGDGNDVVEGGNGADHLEGAGGNDVLRPDGHEDANADYVDGGPGVDRIDEDYSSRYLDRSQQPFVSLDLGGTPSGRPGEGDTIHNVEQVVLNNGGSVTGTDASEVIEYDEVGDPITVNAAGGDDTVTTGDGNDTITGGAGNDTINAGYGNDTINPGPGQDIVHADSTGECNWLYCKYPYGDDTIDARDGAVDHIDCGAGTDTVLADAQDIVDPSCENVTRSGGSGGGQTGGSGGGQTGGSGGGQTGGSGGGQTGGSGGSGGRTGVRLTVIRTRLPDALARGLRVRVAGASAGAMVRLQAKVGRSVAARGSRHAGHSGSATVTLRFTAKARRSLHRKRTARLLITGDGQRIAVTLLRR